MEVLQLLLDRGVPVDARSATGCTGLHAAAAAGCMPAVELLLKAGADVTAVGAEGQGTLHFAAAAGATQVALHLLEVAAHAGKGKSEGKGSQGGAGKIEEGGQKKGETEQDSGEALEESVASKLAGLQDEEGWTPMHHAAEQVGSAWGMHVGVLRCKSAGEKRRVDPM